MDLWTMILGQCPCSGGSRDAWRIWLLVAAGLYAVIWWAETVKKKEGVSRMKGKLAKLAVVVALVAAVGTVLVMKKARTESSAATATAPAAPAVQASMAQASAGVPRLLDLGSTSCIPCKMMAPILEQLKAEQAGKLQVDFIDVWKDEAAGQRYQVHLIPTQIFFDASGKELWRHEGFMAKDEILAKWKELGVELAETAASQPVAGAERANHG